MKFAKPFYGVRAGEVYPVHFAPGDDCPPELQEAAILTGAATKAPAPAAREPAPAKTAKKQSK